MRSICLAQVEQVLCNPKMSINPAIVLTLVLIAVTDAAMVVEEDATNAISGHALVSGEFGVDQRWPWGSSARDVLPTPETHAILTVSKA